MIDSTCRAIYQKWLIDPLLKWERWNHFSPSMMTLFGVMIGLLIPLFLFFHLSGWALASLILSGFCDTLDGSLARRLGVTSSKGALFDILGDRLVEFAIIFGLFLYAPEVRATACLLMLGSVLLCITSFLVVGVFEKNESEKSFHYSPGLMERTEAFLFFALMMLFPSLFFPLAILFSILVFYTACARAHAFIKA